MILIMLDNVILFSEQNTLCVKTLHFHQKNSFLCVCLDLKVQLSQIQSSSSIHPKV